MWKFLTAIPVARETLLQSLKRMHLEISSKEISDYPQDVISLAEEDLSFACGKAWQTAKQLLMEISVHPEISHAPLEPKFLNEVISEAREQFPINYKQTNECGLGRLSVEIGNLIVSDFQIDNLPSTEVFASPIMTVVLDYPWNEISDSHWPVFPLLAQWQLKSMGNYSADDLGDDLAMEFFALLIEGLNRKEREIIYNASYAYLNLSDKQFPLASLCALVGLALDDKSILADVQKYLKDVVVSVDDLVYTFRSPWPLWPLLSLAAR